MVSRSFRKNVLFFLPALIFFLFGMSSISLSAEFWLRAEPMSKTMPDGTVVLMWGFALDQDHDFSTTNDGTPTVPGPTLTVPPGENLVVHLFNNNLPEPVSIVIPGQTVTPTPVRNPDGRVRSFTAETAPGTESTYTWAAIKPGTYLYQSGTHPAVQVQMGLYGAVKKDAGAGQAYSGIQYDTEVTLLFSEIDPMLHIAVAMGDYGPGLGVSSTYHYEPKFFLINGEPFTYGSGAFPAGNPGQRLLVRLLNAGLRDHAAVLQGYYWRVIAEDGNPLLYPKEQYGVLLPAGKTIDAIVTATAPGYIPVYDRRLSLTNGTSSPGGMLGYLRVASLTQYTLTVNAIGPGRVSAASPPGGIDCGIDCTENYNAGTVLRLAALPDPGSSFLGWSGACTNPTGDCIVTITADTEVTATFAGPQDIQVSPASLSFGNLVLFRLRTLSVAMNNVGEADLLVSNVQITGPDAAMFQITNWTGPRTIAPGGSSNLSVVFRPTTRGDKNALLRITSIDPDTPVIEVPLTGTGI